jgi:hypothetical protein
MKEKSQSSMELAILVGAMLFFFLTLLYVFEQNITQKSYEQRDFAMNELALNVQNELSIAAAATDGYQRNFQIQTKLLGMDYSVTLIANSVYINTSDGKHAMSLSVQNVTGNITKGNNFIRKTNGIVYLN